MTTLVTNSNLAADDTSISRSRDLDLPSLHAVEIEINHQCNRSCSYCPNSIAERRVQGQMTPELFTLIIDKLMQIEFAGRLSFDFYNEPMLHPDLANFVAHANEKLPRTSIHLYTNGTLLTTARFKELYRNGINKFVVTRHEEDCKRESYVFEKTFSELSEREKASVKYQKFSEMSFVNRGGLLKNLGPKPEALLPCHLPSHMLTVTVDGTVLACFEDFQEKLAFGNLKEESLTEIWSKEEYRLLRKNLQRGLRHRHKPCDNCNRLEALPPFF